MTLNNDNDGDAATEAVHSTSRDRLTVTVVRATQRIARFPPPHLRKPLMFVAAGVFMTGAVVAASRLDITWASLEWRWIALASIVGVPLTIATKTLEFLISGRVIGVRIGFVAGVKVSVLSSAANLLPIPGSVLVRVQALRQTGQPYGRATYTTAIMGIAWVGVAVLAAGAFLIGFGATFLGTAGSFGGVVMLAVALILASRRLESGVRMRLTAAILGVEILSVAIGGVRLYLVLLALGEQATLTAATLLTLAGVLASASGVLPGGLGLRELFATVLVPLAGVSGAVGFLASAVDRIVGLAVHAPLALLYSARRGEVPNPSEGPRTPSTSRNPNDGSSSG